MATAELKAKVTELSVTDYIAALPDAARRNKVALIWQAMNAKYTA